MFVFSTQGLEDSYLGMRFAGILFWFAILVSIEKAMFLNTGIQNHLSFDRPQHIGPLLTSKLKTRKNNLCRSANRAPTQQPLARATGSRVTATPASQQTVCGRRRCGVALPHLQVRGSARVHWRVRLNKQTCTTGAAIPFASATSGTRF